MTRDMEATQRFSGIFKCPGQGSESVPSLARQGFDPSSHPWPAVGRPWRTETAGRAGEVEGELTFCAPEKAWQGHETLGHMAVPSGLSVPTHLHREGEEVERSK